MNLIDLRSVLLVAACDFGRIKDGLSWRPSAICLDLEGLVHPGKCTQARECARDALQSMVYNQTLALVRINLEKAETDLKAVVCPQLNGVVMPGVESSETIWHLDQYLSALEKELNLPIGRVRLLPFLTTGKGLWFAKDVATASPRVMGIALGMSDLLFDMLGIAETVAYFTGPVPRFPVPEYIWSRLALIAAVSKVQLLGLLGTTVVPDHADSQDLLKAASRARQAGFRGAFVLDRNGVDACRKGFCLPEEAQ